MYSFYTLPYPRTESNHRSLLLKNRLLFWLAPLLFCSKVTPANKAERNFFCVFCKNNAVALCGLYLTPRPAIFNLNAKSVFSFFAFCFSVLNNAERSYFLSFKNNGVTLCDWVQLRRFAFVTKKQTLTYAKNRGRFPQNHRRASININPTGQKERPLSTEPPF